VRACAKNHERVPGRGVDLKKQAAGSPAARLILKDEAGETPALQYSFTPPDRAGVGAHCMRPPRRFPNLSRGFKAV
jgi:hypothetical protein